MTSPEPSTLMVGIVSQWYAPEPVLIPKTVSDAVKKAGHRVRVLTGFPSYPGGVRYRGFDDVTVRTEDVDGADVLRVVSFLSHDQSAIRRIRSFLSFSIASLRHSRFLSSCDVVYVYGTPMTAAAVAVLLRRLRGIPFVIHIQDLWPESVVDSGMLKFQGVQRLLGNMISIWLRSVYRWADHLFVISPGMRSTLIDRGVHPEKVSVLLNWDASWARSRTPQSPVAKNNERIRCVYAGNIGMMQDVETIVRAAAEVQNDVALDVLIYGSGVAEEDAKKLAQELGAKNVKFMGRVSSEGMREVYEQSDFQLVTLKDRAVFRMTIPSKFQASLANGVPIITTVQGDLASICAEKGIGLVAEPESPSSLASAFRQAAALGSTGRADMASKAWQFYWDHLAEEKATMTIASSLTSIAVHNREKRSAKITGGENS